MTALAESHRAATEPPTEPEEEDLFRSALYRVLATLLSEPPSSETLSTLRTTPPSDGSLGAAFARLAQVAAATGPQAEARAYHDLFIGLGRGDLVPYGSYYLTGFLQEKPLAKLRADLHRLGVEASRGTSDPEDHVAAILETLAGCIDGQLRAPLDVGAQRTFFDRHVVSWMPVFFKDLEANDRSEFYRAVGSLGRVFVALEAEAFALA